MPEVTVLTTTYGGRYAEERYTALCRQTFKDFEWIVVDDCYGKHEQLYADMKADFNITHIPPRVVKPYFAKASALNDGLILAKGKFIYFMNDYSIPHIRCIERHVAVQKEFGGLMLSGRALMVERLPKYFEGERVIGADYRMSLFKDGYCYFKPTPINDMLFEVHRDGVENWMNGRNDSCPLQPLIDCNGFEEKCDGRWGGEDSDMAHRLMTYGLRFFMDKGSVTFELPHESGAKKGIRTEDEQVNFKKTITEPKIKNKIFTSDNEWNLKEARCPV